jgi:hypothetical protein
MKPLSRRRRYLPLLAFVPALLLAYVNLSGQTQPPPPPPQQPPGAQVLEVDVVVPPSWRPMFEDRVTDAFTSNVADVFQNRGFKGQIKQISSLDQPTSAAPRLTINLVEWRMNFTGNIDCTFSATLQVDRTVRHLGAFNGMSFRWMSGPGRFGAADAYNDAAADALRQLYDAVVKTGLVPGATQRK